MQAVRMQSLGEIVPPGLLAQGEVEALATGPVRRRVCRSAESSLAAGTGSAVIMGRVNVPAELASEFLSFAISRTLDLLT